MEALLNDIFAGKLQFTSLATAKSCFEDGPGRLLVLGSRSPCEALVCYEARLPRTLRGHNRGVGSGSLLSKDHHLAPDQTVLGCGLRAALSVMDSALKVTQPPAPSARFQTQEGLCQGSRPRGKTQFGSSSACTPPGCPSSAPCTMMLLEGWISHFLICVGQPPPLNSVQIWSLV